MHFARTITRMRVRMIALALALALTSAVVAACGSDDNESSTSGSGAAASTAKSTSTPAAANENSAGVTDYVKYVGGTAGAADNSKSPIVIGYVNQQGGANDVGPNSTIGAQMAADYVNKYAGGIDGHPVKLHTCFISTSEEQGQQCGQKMANDKDVDVVGVGAVAVGAQPLNASIGGEKPMVWGVSVNQVDTKNKNGYILFGDSFHILAPWGTFGRDVLKAKTAAVVYPQVPGIIEGANAMVAGLEKAGIEVKRVGYEPNATDLVGPLTAAGAQSADMIVPQSDAKGCINLAKALEQTGVKSPVVSNPLCLSPVVSKGLGGDVPKWYYGIASSLTADQTDPAAKAMVDAMTKLGKQDLAADPWVPTSMATVLTIIKFMNEVGADNLTSQAIADKAKAFKGPLVFGAPEVQCAKYPDAPAVCNDQTQFFDYSGKGQFKNASGFVRPPE
jgi:ABC-type branched-subunit amino acid transport system substrate-binding protein